MHLKSLTLKGFKSFPDRTTLEFGPGVSVIVGPNGSGKSNVTDAVLWVMGEQSPTAIRGRSMQDVIFGGGKGVKARTSAEVEVVLDNADGGIDLPLGEISVSRRLDRNGDGEYRINGAKCRLVDVLELLSDTGLGKEAHSVISQGKIESIVTSKPRDRRLLIEEAAGLGKHRKRRRRAQLKLDRTQDNLDRALDVEREARARLKPLKRQAEAAELHQRLERQEREVRWELAREAVRERDGQREQAEANAGEARERQHQLQSQLDDVAARRQEAEHLLAARSEQRELLATRAERARSAAERIEGRRERVAENAERLTGRIERRAAQLHSLEALAAADGASADDGSSDRIAALEEQIAGLDSDRAAALERELATLESERSAAQERADEAKAELERCASALTESGEICEIARTALRAASQTAERARREAAELGAAVARANQFLRSATDRGAGDAHSLADELSVEPGLELAVSAALGARLSAAVVADRAAGERLLDGSGADGGRALVVGPTHGASAGPPLAGASALADVVAGAGAATQVAQRLLADAWLVDDLAGVPDNFQGIAVTRAGRAWIGQVRELRQAAPGGAERVLAVRNERDELVGRMDAAVREEQAALAAVESAQVAVGAAESGREDADNRRRAAARGLAEAEEAVRQAGWLIDERRRLPEQGEAALRRAQVEGELAAERRVAEEAARQRRERADQIEALSASLVRDRALLPVAERLGSALGGLHDAAATHAAAVAEELAEYRRAGEGVAAALRACATEEAGVQQQLRAIAEAVTGAEVRAQQARDSLAESRGELEEVATALGLVAEPRAEAMAADERQSLEARRERLVKRRAQLGPVNPLAEEEYAEALAHVEELERQRDDLETALRELRGVIRDTDRQIEQTFTETFEAAAANFSELAGTLFPGGSGRLTLVKEHSNAPVVATEGGEKPSDAAIEASAEAEAAAEEAALEGLGPDDDLGVEIEITPAGKSMKRLSLLSGGEKTMTAIAFLFSVFLARPCPFYILDEVEAALDDRNITRYLDLLAAHAGRAQFIIVTHQKRTMEAADTLYGVSMGGDGISQVVSRKMTDHELAGRVVVPV
ncbi:MAG: AAA family ATPase [Baekduia sp.]